MPRSSLGHCAVCRHAWSVSGSSTKCSTAPTAETFPGDGSLAHAQEIRSHLAGCGVSVAQQTVPAGALSGGQRSRVALAAVSFSRPHLLVLDEPTNNLDLEAVAALADAVHRCLRGRSGMLPSGSCALLRTAKSRARRRCSCPTSSTSCSALPGRCTSWRAVRCVRWSPSPLIRLPLPRSYPLWPERWRRHPPDST